MSLKEDLRAANAAQDKLATYCKGLPKGSKPTKKYYELNRKAHAAINKLPPLFRNKFCVDFFGG